MLQLLCDVCYVPAIGSTLRSVEVSAWALVSSVTMQLCPPVGVWGKEGPAATLSHIFTTRGLQVRSCYFVPCTDGST